MPLDTGTRGMSMEELELKLKKKGLKPDMEMDVSLKRNMKHVMTSIRQAVSELDRRANGRGK